MVAPNKPVTRRQQTSLVAWVIYDHPRDYPAHWVVRRWVNGVPDPICGLAKTLAGVRSLIPGWPGRYVDVRSPEDGPTIAEVWT